MARARFEHLDPARREAILRAAGEEFAGHGYGGSSLNRIISAAGISKGSLYYYFDDKADLFASVVGETVERLVADVGSLDLDRLDRTSYWDALRRFGQQSTEVMRRDAWYVRLALAFPRLREEPDAAAGAVGRALEWSRRMWTDLLSRGRELRVVRRDVPLGLLVEVTMAADEAGDRWMVGALDEYQGEGLARLVDVRVDMVRGMLEAADDRSRPASHAGG